MKISHFVQLVLLLPMCWACERSADEFESLVGASNLPSRELLLRETISISQGFGDGTTAHLSYVLRPDNSLSIAIEDYGSEDSFPWEPHIRTETFVLADNVAENIRRSLWRIRPVTLDGWDSETRPLGCEPLHADELGEFVVVFIDNQGADIEPDDPMGLFALPSDESCVTSEAVQARALLRRVLQRMPKSELAEEFSRYH